MLSVSVGDDNTAVLAVKGDTVRGPRYVPGREVLTARIIREVKRPSAPGTLMSRRPDG